MLYILLIIIIGLLIKLIYFPINRGLKAQKHWNKMFNKQSSINIEEYKRDDPRNNIFPDETVKLENGSIASRRLAGLFDAMGEEFKKQEKL